MNEYDIVCTHISHCKHNSYVDYCINNGHTPTQMCSDEHIHMYVCAMHVCMFVWLMCPGIDSMSSA